MYKKLDENKMWRLKTGKLVEKTMEEFSNKCNYEHHSLIFDISDKTWEKYFTVDEIKEIKTTEFKSLAKLDEPSLVI
ncbi:hypothetical protein K501DRAFT_285163 [Backusella circina FSU 941]|nr:hypothetical protein K501DRAFT_285163 [Backusella circina FSU 941]